MRSLYKVFQMTWFKSKGTKEYFKKSFAKAGSELNLADILNPFIKFFLSRRAKDNDYTVPILYTTDGKVYLHEVNNEK